MKPSHSHISVRGLRTETRINDIFEVFQDFGTITSCRLITDKRNESKGYCFISYSTPEEAELALHSMNNKRFDGATLNILYATLQNEMKFDDPELQGVKCPPSHPECRDPPTPNNWERHYQYASYEDESDTSEQNSPNMPNYQVKSPYYQGPPPPPPMFSQQQPIPPPPPPPSRIYQPPPPPPHISQPLLPPTAQQLPIRPKYPPNQPSQSSPPPPPHMNPQPQSRSPYRYPQQGDYNYEQEFQREYQFRTTGGKPPQPPPPPPLRADERYSYYQDQRYQPQPIQQSQRGPPPAYPRPPPPPGYSRPPPPPMHQRPPPYNRKDRPPMPPPLPPGQHHGGGYFEPD